ncbi:hypothetical protein L873DRAFT_1939113 [Choiromyces venosus 120613-1]|uniref:Uncharacterized protein n=1 Tax=Choiromyces venosus 120613-1 TaxID=1336337 RepID=A0A3N4K787_9PEZI|nr:hypothetical protein L873DRAFT_1939113 [Choiromyces venosus 120613-1]
MRRSDQYSLDDTFLMPFRLSMVDSQSQQLRRLTHQSTELKANHHRSNVNAPDTKLLNGAVIWLNCKFSPRNMHNSSQYI